MPVEFTVEQAIQQMLSAHPQPSKTDNAAVIHCIEACVSCATTCTACADACLGEEMVNELVNCIRTNLDCAEICRVTTDILVRQSEMYWRLLSYQVEACQAACRTCAGICEQHAKMHEHCRVCAEVCRQCEQACGQLLETFPA